MNESAPPPFNQQTIRDIFAISSGIWPLDLGEIIQPPREQLQEAQIARQPSEPTSKPRALSLKLAIRIVYTRGRGSRCPAEEERKASHATAAAYIQFQSPDLENSPSAAMRCSADANQATTTP